MLSLLIICTDKVRADTQAEHIVWNKTPITVTLKTGEERLIHFPAPVRAGLPPTFSSALRVQSINGTLYLRASEAFDSTRILVREVDGIQTYLLDIKASDNGQTHPIYIHAKQTGDPDTSSEGLTENTPEDGAAAEFVPQHGYVSLTRFAAQQVYAPQRLLKDLADVHRVPLVFEHAALVRGGRVMAEPLISWVSEGLYVTAVQLTNTSHRPIILDPRELRGQWLAATFQHVRLHPAGTQASTTCVYVVSARPFDESLP